MPSFTLEWDSRDLEPFRDARVEKALVRALAKAGGDAARFLRTGSSRLIRQRKRFKAKRLSEALRLTFPRGARSLDSLVWHMDVSGAPVPVIDFPHRQTSKGVSVGINVAKRTLIKSAFLATMRSGHEGVFYRETKKRLPIDEAFTTKVSDVFQDTGFTEWVMEGAQVKFKNSFERLFPLELGKAE